MDVTGHLIYQINSIAYAAKEESELSLFAARYPFFINPFGINQIEQQFLKAAFLKSPPHTFNRFSLIRDSFFDLSVVFLLFTSN